MFIIASKKEFSFASHILSDFCFQKALLTHHSSPLGSTNWERSMVALLLGTRVYFLQTESESLTLVTASPPYVLSLYRLSFTSAFLVGSSSVSYR